MLYIKKTTESSKDIKTYPPFVRCVASSGEVDPVEKKKQKLGTSNQSQTRLFFRTQQIRNIDLKKFSSSRIFPNKSTKNYKWFLTECGSEIFSFFFQPNSVLRNSIEKMRSRNNCLHRQKKIFFSLAGLGASSKRRDPVENINENSQVPDPDLTRFFFSSQDSEKHSILHKEITLT